MPGIWTNEGNHQLLDVYAKGATPPDLYVGLYMTPTTDPGVDGNGGLDLTLAGLTEPSEGEYARILVEPGDWTLVDNLLTAAEVNFVASGLAWGIIYGWFVCDCRFGDLPASSLPLNSFWMLPTTWALPEKSRSWPASGLALVFLPWPKGGVAWQNL